MRPRYVAVVIAGERATWRHVHGANQKCFQHKKRLLRALLRVIENK